MALENWLFVVVVRKRKKKLNSPKFPPKTRKGKTEKSTLHGDKHWTSTHISKLRLCYGMKMSFYFLTIHVSLRFPFTYYSKEGIQGKSENIFLHDTFLLHKPQVILSKNMQTKLNIEWILRKSFFLFFFLHNFLDIYRLD